jgi:hypothetical protein
MCAVDADADRADLELRLIKRSLKDRTRVHPFAGPRHERSIATLVGSSVRSYFLHICLERASNLATGLSVCQSSTSWLSTSRLADLMADSSSIQSS